MVLLCGRATGSSLWARVVAPVIIRTGGGDVAYGSWEVGDMFRRSEKLVERAYSAGSALTLFQYAKRGFAKSLCLFDAIFVFIDRLIDR